MDTKIDVDCERELINELSNASCDCDAFSDRIRDSSASCDFSLSSSATSFERDADSESDVEAEAESEAIDADSDILELVDPSILFSIESEADALFEASASSCKREIEFDILVNSDKLADAFALNESCEMRSKTDSEALFEARSEAIVEFDAD
ncbi:hypothetical protein IV67_GL001261 [Weissella minor]|uniref:Uncharacterized protein n=1 Tax=Weissella minor TaxID=1620 RepID=A0A0R2JFR7_9LACO|nr:hypothetical protein IV67_GL001261 [Weissella minor]